MIKWQIITREPDYGNINEFNIPVLSNYVKTKYANYKNVFSMHESKKKRYNI